MNLSDDGAALIKYFEDCKLIAYPDPHTGGVPWTIGWGHTRGVQPGDTCTQEEADAWFLEDIEPAERMIENQATVRTLEQGQFDALVSFVYNVGPGKKGVKDGLFALKTTGQESTLLRKLRTGNIEDAAKCFLHWVNPGSSVERGLLRRRVAEAALFMGEDWREALQVHLAAGG
jgi:lysozyme